MQAGRASSWQNPETARPAAARLDHSGRLDRWERLEQPTIAVLPYAMLTVASVLAIFLTVGALKTVITLGIAAFTGAWMLWGTLHPAWRARPAWVSVFFAVLVTLMAALVLLSPIYGFFSFTGYFFAFWLPAGRWRLLGVAVVATITATSQAGGLPSGSLGSFAVYAVFILINIAVAGSFTWFGWVSAEQNDRRKLMLSELSESNRKLEATLAENAGLHEQLLVQAREAGVTDERRRMAREIHDTLAQSLAGIITQLQAADQVGRDGERRRHLDAALRLARESLSEARRSVHALRPEPLQASRIEEALGIVTERWSGLHDIQATVTTTGSARPIPSEAELTLLRTAQEALTNVAKHAGATRVGLTLSYIGDQVTLDIRDDGIGFACPAGGDVGLVGQPVGASASGGGVSGGGRGGVAAGALAAGDAGHAGDAGDAGDRHLTGGFGLMAMRQRVEGLAGTLAIESEPGIGTTISASLPVTVAGSGR